jgi:hypothetical protein
MKTKKTIIFAGLILLASALFVFSCDVPLALGNRLDIEGPLVEFISPAPRTAVKVQFDIEGRVSDESPIKELLINASLNNEDFPKQWRYTRDSGWQVSQDHGKSWDTYPDAQWNGSEKRADWMIHIDMGNDTEDGEYLFAIQAWDSGGFTDDNSYKTRVLIMDRDPPKVSVSNPYLYDRFAVYESGSFSNAELQSLHVIDDDGIERKDPAMIGKFITQDFPLQWQIDDSFDVWSIDLRLYTPDVPIDGEPETSLSDDYIFSYHQNTPPGPDNPPDPLNTINPNGNINVPALDGPSGYYDGGHLKNPITGKTTIRVVAVCYDSAGNANNEKTLGFFVYWPKADWPWIAFSDGMEEPDYYTDLLNKPEGAGYGGDLESLLKDKAFMIYPGRTVKATAFHAHGLTKVEYSLYVYDEKTGETSSLAMEDYDSVIIDNPQRPNGSYSTVFPWEFTPPPRTGYYVVRAKSYSAHKSSEELVALFRVQDISFPNFPVEPSPSATEPLFKFIGLPEKEGAPNDVPDNHIRISGIVSDATEIVSLSMVWINPESRNYAAMSQLQYFRDSSYAGWAEAKKLSKGGTDTENETTEYPNQRYPYDPARPNRLWNIEFNDDGLDIDTGRRRYTYSILIDLNDLHIGMTAQPLSSQVFLLRAENPDNKCTIITYAPQGDTLAPTIKINEVRISREGREKDVVCIPGEYEQVPKFAADDIITVTGEWEEDSTEYLPVETYLYNNMGFSINGFGITNTVPGLGITVTRDPAGGTKASGTFTITAEVKETDSPFTASNMKDTLVVNATIRDIGGNPSEAAASWLIENDNLRFLRISSIDEDTAYKAGDEIEIFLEFNKPVTLKNKNSNPVLTLNTTGGAAGRASYRTDPPQDNESTRHYFTYTVGAGQNTPDGVNLNVDGLSIDGGSSVLPVNSPAWQDEIYPFTWIYTGMQPTDKEEIRITRGTSDPQHPHNGTEIIDGKYYARALPVTTTQSDPDYTFTLIGGKRITVDNQPPTITGISASPQGWHTTNADIYITATFSEMVRLGPVMPYLILNASSSSPGNRTSIVPADIRVNNKQITFRYMVKANDSANPLQVTGIGGDILDIPGTRMTAFSSTTLTGVSIDTTAPARPTVTVHNGTPPANQIGTSGNAAVNLNNRYDENLFVRIAGTGAAGDNTNLGRIEYTPNGGQNWISATSTPINVQLENNGSYNVQARQIDQAGNTSATSNAVSFNWDKGSLVSRIDSSTANGTYSTNTTTASINVTIYFRKPLNFSNTQSITLNVTRGAAAMPAITQNITSNNASSLSFTYTIANNDNTPTGTGRTPYLDVTALNLQATDADGVNVNAFLTLPTDTSLLLGQRKDIIVQTGALTVSSGPTYNITAANDEATGTISITFNRAISKGSGNITIAQSTTGYRLPAVLTEAQSTRYRSARNFSTYYTRGTNGFSNGSADTATKFVLNYAESTVVTPSNANNASAIQQMAYDFLQAETVTLPVTSQDVEVVNNNTLRITLSGSNALQVLGATYTVTIPQNCVQDSLGYRWPTANAGQTYNTTISGINKSFVRVDKKTNRDSVERTTGTGSDTNPWLTANLTNVLQTTARLDCRTPNSVVRYNVSEQRFDARGAANTATGTNNPTGTGGTGNPPGRPSQTGTDGYWKNTDADANNISTLTQPTNPQTNGTNYTNFTGDNTNAAGPHIQVGDDTEHGYVWRISTRSRNGATGNTYGDISEEIAFRTVLTVQLDGMTTNSLGTPPASGDALWIRGGDAISSSSVPGFPLTWGDDFSTLRTEGRRAGIRLMTMKSANNAGFGTASEWKWITWEINVRTYYDIVLGRDAGGGEPDAAKAWQYGPRGWGYQRGGWSVLKDRYTLYPGKHRWLRIHGGDYDPGGALNFSHTFSSRPDLDTSITRQP